MAKSLTIELPDHTHQDLEERAEKAGSTAEKHAVELIRKALRDIDGEPQQSVVGLRQQLTDSIVRSGQALFGKR